MTVSLKLERTGGDADGSGEPPGPKTCRYCGTAVEGSRGAECRRCDSLEEQVAQWHAAKKTVDQTLSAFLGMTDSEHAQWATARQKRLGTFARLAEPFEMPDPPAGGAVNVHLERLGDEHLNIRVGDKHITLSAYDAARLCGHLALWFGIKFSKRDGKKVML